MASASRPWEALSIADLLQTLVLGPSLSRLFLAFHAAAWAEGVDLRLQQHARSTRAVCSGLEPVQDIHVRRRLFCMPPDHIYIYVYIYIYIFFFYREVLLLKSMHSTYFPRWGERCTDPFFKTARAGLCLPPVRSRLAPRLSSLKQRDTSFCTDCSGLQATVRPRHCNENFGAKG